MQRGWVVSADYRLAIEAIKQARIDRGLSQREVARRLNKPPSFVNKIELMERRLDILEFLAICQALEADAKELLDTIIHKLKHNVPSLGGDSSVRS